MGSLIAIVSLVAGAAYGGNGIGGVFNLGQSNGVNATTTLTGATAGPQLSVNNTSTGGGATGLNITTATGKPPLVVNSTAQVQNLNASLLSGLKAGSQLQLRVSGTCPSGQAANGVGLFGNMNCAPYQQPLTGDACQTTGLNAGEAITAIDASGTFTCSHPLPEAVKGVQSGVADLPATHTNVTVVSTEPWTLTFDQAAHASALVQASAVVVANGGLWTVDDFSCQIYVDGLPWGNPTNGAVYWPGDSFNGSGDVTGAKQLNTPMSVTAMGYLESGLNTISLVCKQSSGDDDINVINANITAIATTEHVWG